MGRKTLEEKGGGRVKIINGVGKKESTKKMGETNRGCVATGISF